MIKKGYEAIKDTLLDPDSMIIYDCYAWTSQSENQYEAEKEAQKDNPEAELADDLFVTYYHVGARNRMGGMSEKLQNIFDKIYDINLVNISFDIMTSPYWSTVIWKIRLEPPDMAALIV